MSDYYAKIIEREFRKFIGPADRHGMEITVDMSEDEIIKVTVDGDVFTCDCDSDEQFYFYNDETETCVTFPIPADYLIEGK